MDFQGLTDELGQLLSEASIEISNLDDRENIVYRRLRAMQFRLQALQPFAVEFKSFVASIEDLAGVLDVSSDQTMAMAAAGNFGELQFDGRGLSPDEFALIDPDQDLAKMSLKLTFAEMWKALDRVEQSRQTPSRTNDRPGLRKFAGSEQEISSATGAREQRHG